MAPTRSSTSSPSGLRCGNAPNGIFASRVQYTKVRHCTISTTGNGYYNSSSGLEFRQTVMDCAFSGDEPWLVSNIGSAEGIDVKGTSDIVAHNICKGFADGISVDPYTSTKTVPYGSNNNCYDCYGNFVSECGDDGIELDHVVANCRAWRNAVASTRTGFSNQPLFGGPCYIFRNEVFTQQDGTNGTASGSAYKLHNGASGTVLIHNTSSKNAGGVMTCMFQNSFLRNNVFMGATDAFTMYTCGTINALPPTPSINDWDNDAYRAGSGRTLVDWFNQQNYTSLTLLASQRQVEGHGILTTYTDFVQAVPPSLFGLPSQTFKRFRLPAGGRGTRNRRWRCPAQHQRPVRDRRQAGHWGNGVQPAAAQIWPSPRRRREHRLCRRQQ